MKDSPCQLQVKRLSRTTSVLARRKTLKRFASAWAAKDVEAIMSCMTANCIYGASIGPEPGKTYRGFDEVRDGVSAMLAYDRTIRSDVFNLRIFGPRAVWEWRYVRRDAEGHEIVDHGCDLIVFRGNRIAVKQGFRKVRTE
jgi:SnoaL-like domain